MSSSLPLIIDLNHDPSVDPFCMFRSRDISGCLPQITSEELKESIEFSAKFKEYDKIYSEEELPPFQSLHENRLCIIADMHKNGHHVPTFILEKVEKYQRNLKHSKMERDLCRDLITRHKVDCKELRRSYQHLCLMYDKYCCWYEKTFPNSKKPTILKFLITLESYQDVYVQ